MDLLIQLGVISLLSYPISFAINVSTVLKETKDIADEGYIYNAKELKSLKIESILIEMQKYPIFNVFAAMQVAVSYNKNKERELLSLSTLNCINKMTKDEQMIYNLKPTALTALDLAKKRITKEKIQDVLKEFNLDGNVEMKYENNKIKLEVTKNNKDKNNKITETVNTNELNDNEYDLSNSNDYYESYNNNEIKEKPRTRSLVNKRR